MNVKEKIGVVGLGYVGLTLATVLAEAGYKVVGVEKRGDVVDKTNAGQPHFAETGLQEALSNVVFSGALEARTCLDTLSPCDVYIITVGTPLSAEGTARLDMIEAASHQVAENMCDGALVVLRSTVRVGTARDVVAPILSASGKRFDLAMCPERTLEGKALQELRELPQIVGADDQSVRDRASVIFRRLTSTIIQVSSLEAAEIVKLVDNTFRDVQFAFANEVARICEVFCVNACEVIASGKLGYERTNVPLPGLVGGPCLEKDPHILAQSVRSKGIDLEITRASRLVNERQPRETVGFIVSQMAKRAMGTGVKVAILGMAFKGVPATDDLRGSMSIRVLETLLQSRPDADITVFDPVIPVTELGAQVQEVSIAETIEDAVRNASVVVIANNHPSLREKSLSAIRELMASDGFIYDYWNHFSILSNGELQDSYFAVGNIGSIKL